MQLITTTNAKSKISVCKLCDALNIPRASYYRSNNTGNIKSKYPPKNALAHGDAKIVLGVLYSERFVDKTPYEVYYTLLDEDKYYCSIRTMYRLLDTHNATQDRRQQRRHRDTVKPELIATRPNEVWSWDITKLRSTQRLVHYQLYVIIDIFSRYVVGWLVSGQESKDFARKLIHESVLKQGVSRDTLTLHSDNGPSMTSSTVAQLLEHLGILKTHNRPYTSNDNPYSEAQFKTLKYCPEFPNEFSSLEEAEVFCKKFFSWYNKSHHHCNIAWLPPEVVHYGNANHVLYRRHQTLLRAYEKDSLRFNHKPPRLKNLPSAVYINPPQTISLNSLPEEKSMA